MNITLICDKSAQFTSRVESILTEYNPGRVTCVASLDEVVQGAREGSAMLLVIGPSIPTADALAAVAALRDGGCSACIVLTVDEVSPQVLHQALRAGIDDVLPMDAPYDEYQVVLGEAVGKANRRGSAGADASESAVSGTVVTVFSTKGGVGKTVVSTNLATALAQSGKAVALVDLDLQFGDVGIMMGVEPTHTIVGAVQSGDRLDAEMLKGFMITHSSGVRLLLAPTQPEDAEIITANRVDRIIRLLASMHDFVVIDTPPVLDETVLTAIDRSDRVLSVTMMDVASVKNSRVSLQKLRQLGYNGTLIDVMLNRADSKVYLNPESVQQALGVKAKYRLPSDLQIPRAVNKGVPVVMEAPRSQPAKVLVSVAKSIIAEHEEAESSVA